MIGQQYPKNTLRKLCKPMQIARVTLKTISFQDAIECCNSCTSNSKQYKENGLWWKCY